MPPFSYPYSRDELRHGQLTINPITTMDRRILQKMTVSEWAMGFYFDLVPIDHSRGNGKGSRIEYKLTEIWDGAWECYHNVECQGESNWLLTQIHLGYLDLIKECRADGDESEWDAYKDFIRQQVELTHKKGYSDKPIPMRVVRKYLNLSFDELTAFNRPTLKLELL